METRELTDMTAVLRSINDGNPSNAERWVTLTQRVVRAETRANAAERAAARKDWEKQNAEYDSWQSNYRAEVAQQEAAKAQDNAVRWKVLALTNGRGAGADFEHCGAPGQRGCPPAARTPGHGRNGDCYPAESEHGGAAMTVLEWLQELEEEERIVKVGCVDNTLRGLRRCTARMAAASYLHWACPEYLAPQLGLAFECKSPAVNNEKFCERCAAAFLSAQMPNTGRVKKPWTHQ